MTKPLTPSGCALIIPCAVTEETLDFGACWHEGAPEFVVPLTPSSHALTHLQGDHQIVDRAERRGSFSPRTAEALFPDAHATAGVRFDNSSNLTSRFI